MQRILNGFFRLSLPKVFGQKARQWLADDNDRQLKDQALLDVAEKTFRPATTVRKSTLRSLNAVRKRIGLPRVKYNTTIPEYKQTAVTRLSRPVWTTVAAALVPLFFIAGAVGYFMTKATPENTSQPYIAIVAGQEPENVTLPDGSQVTFSNGTLEYAEDFIENRTIKLSGEAYLDVVSDAERPFSVDLGRMEVTVLGTKFSVRALSSEDNTEVTLAEGSISVRAEGVSEATVLKPGQRFAYDRVSKQAELSEAPRDEVMQAMGARLAFENKSVEDILMSIGLYYNVDMAIAPGIVFDNDLVVSFVGDESLDDVMFTLQTVTGKFDYDIKNGKVLITEKR